MLTARAAGTVRIDANVIHVDLDFLRVLHLRHDVASRKRRMAARIRIKGRNAHKAMDALFRFQVTVSVMAFDEQHHGLDAGLVAGLQVQRLHGKTVPFRPAPIHPKEHLRPVLRFGTARAGVKFEICVIRVVFAGKQKLQLQRAEIVLQHFQLRLHVRLDGLVLFLHAHFPERQEVVGLRNQRVISINAAFQVGQLLIERLRRIGVVPEIRGAHLVF